MKNVSFTILFAACAAAQIPSEPPALVRVIRSQVPPGIKVYADVHAAVTVLGMNSISGPSESWLIEMHDSFATIEDLDTALSVVMPQNSNPPALTSDDVLTPSRTLIAFYRPGWSYRPEEAVKLLLKARYFQASIYRNRSGDDAAFGALLRSRTADLDNMNIDRPDLAYEVISGAPSGTYLLLTPLTSLRTLDDSLAAHAGRADGATKTVANIAHEHLLFRIEPGFSYMPPASQ